jgi:hypothetical protein
VRRGEGRRSDRTGEEEESVYVPGGGRGQGRRREGRMTEVGEGKEKKEGRKMEVREERREGSAIDWRGWEQQVLRSVALLSVSENDLRRGSLMKVGVEI